jgi:ABC-type transport system involved in multi-copper enzyme maturation permease subunit
VLIISTIISVLPVEMFEAPKQFLFTRYIDLWQKAFQDPMQMTEIWKGIQLMGIWTLSSVLLAWWVFVRKDILS